MVLLKQFALSKLFQIAVFFLIFIVYLCNFLLWHLPMRSLFNSTLLVLAIYLIYLVCSYFSFRKDEQYFSHLIEENENLLAELKDKDLANKEFLDLIKVWSHQMKVPLAAIDLMSQTNLNEKELKSELRNQTFTLENYLNILLETQRITNLTNDFRFEKVSFSSLMKNLLRKYSSFFIEKNLSVELSGDWELVSDGRWLSLALEQLLNNAVKYTTSGSIKIQMTEGELQLSDTGIGIMSEDLPRLFEHGFTGYNGRIQKKSSGLGLYLTQLIFKKLEFEVAIESKLGKGTMVIVRKVEK